MNMQLSRVREQTWIKVFRAEAVTQQDGRCAYCKAPVTMSSATADHVACRKYGGQTNRENIVASCFDCNIAKGSMSEKTFLKHIRTPKAGDCLRIWRASFRLRLWRATHASCDRINRMVT